MLGPGKLIELGSSRPLVLELGKLLVLGPGKPLVMGLGKLLVLGPGNPLVLGPGKLLLLRSGALLLLGPGKLLLLGPGKALVLGPRALLPLGPGVEPLELDKGTLWARAFLASSSSVEGRLDRRFVVVDRRRSVLVRIGLSSTREQCWSTHSWQDRYNSSRLEMDTLSLKEFIIASIIIAKTQNFQFS